MENRLAKKQVTPVKRGNTSSSSAHEQKKGVTWSSGLIGTPVSHFFLLHYHDSLGDLLVGTDVRLYTPLGYQAA